MTGSAGEEDSSDSEPELVSSSLSSSSAESKTWLVNVQLELGDGWHLLCGRVQQENLQSFRGGAILIFSNEMRLSNERTVGLNEKMGEGVCGKLERY